MTTPPYDELVELTRSEGAALLDAAKNRLDAPVRTCGDWTAARLLGHVGRVYKGAATMLATRATAAPVDKPAPPGADVVEYFAEGLAAVTDALAATRPDDDVWNWGAERPAGAIWWARRMAYETVVHRADADLAAGQPLARETVPAATAADGIDEFLEFMLPRQQRRAPATDLRGTLHLHATDDDLPAGAGEWLLTLSPISCDISRGHAKGDAALRGPAYELLLVLYNRLPTDAVDAHGDGRLLAAWRSQVTV
jgi:uncharacterized protein (TIGR03083 family)